MILRETVNTLSSLACEARASIFNSGRHPEAPQERAWHPSTTYTMAQQASEDRDDKLSKSLTYLCRHGAEKARLQVHKGKCGALGTDFQGTGQAQHHV